ncbi:MAG: hypothetical protein P1U61_02790 [Legionellaceae bacterium]|nr:hypothetical protein [Legionellaceae bacterium]
MSIFRLGTGEAEIAWNGGYPTVTLNYLEQIKFQEAVNKLQQSAFRFDFSWSDFSQHYRLSLYSHTPDERSQVELAVKRLREAELISGPMFDSLVSAMDNKLACVSDRDDVSYAPVA